MVKEKHKLEIKAFRIHCHECGCEYLEEINWVESVSKSECPNCHTILIIT